MMSRSLALMLVLAGCYGVDEVDQPTLIEETSEALASCSDTSISVQLRAFIPETLCGIDDGPDDSLCSKGFDEPFAIGTCHTYFHGDFRGFSSAWEASHRLGAIVTTPIMRGDSCSTSVGHSTDCDASHHCACFAGGLLNSCLTPDCFTEAATATPSVAENSTTCGTNALDAQYQVKAAYPFNPLSPDIYDKIEVKSSGSGAPNWGLYGSSQEYTVDVWHTPFPFHELLIQYACGQKVAQLYTYSAPDCGPSTSNLGDGVKEAVHHQNQFAIIYDPRSGVSLGPAGAQPPPVCGTVLGGQELDEGQSILSCDGRFRLTLQPDGNLVLYQGSGPLWASGTNGRGGVVARMQTDGNLVVYTAGGTALWASNTNGNPGAYVAAQSDGNLVIYSSGGRALWASGTSLPCGCYSGNGAYCGFKVIEHADSTHCVLPFPFNAGNIYNCTNGGWSQEQACAGGQCTFNPSGADHCTQSCGGPVCGSACCPAGDWCGTGGKCCNGCAPGCPC